MSKSKDQQLIDALQDKEEASRILREGLQKRRQKYGKWVRELADRNGCQKRMDSLRADIAVLELDILEARQVIVDAGSEILIPSTETPETAAEVGSD